MGSMVKVCPAFIIPTALLPAKLVKDGNPCLQDDSFNVPTAALFVDTNVKSTAKEISCPQNPDTTDGQWS